MPPRRADSVASHHAHAQELRQSEPSRRLRFGGRVFILAAMDTGKVRRTAPSTARTPAISSAIPDEVARFAALSGRWWDEDGPFRPLHRINPARLTFVRDRLCAHFARDPRSTASLRGLAVLDIGCGGGLLCEPLARLGARVCGIDAAEESVAAAASHARQNGLGIEYQAATPESLADEGRLFDAVISLEVVEHVEDVDAFLAASGKLVRPGGIMLLSTINRTLTSLAQAKIGAEYLLRWVPPGTHDWRKFVRPSELARGLRHAGLSLMVLRGLSYVPAEDDWRLADDLSVNYLAAAVKDGATPAP